MKFIFILGILIILLSGLVSASFNYKPPKDVIIEETDDGIIINGVKMTTPTLQKYDAFQIGTPSTIKYTSIGMSTTTSSEVRYIKEIELNNGETEIPIYYNETPLYWRKIAYQVPQTLTQILNISLNQLQDYCDKHVEYCTSELGYYYILYYPWGEINTYMINESTGYKYNQILTPLKEGIRIDIINPKKSMKGNDFAISSGDLYCNGPSHINRSGNFTRFLNNTIPECFETNTSKLDDTRPGAIVNCQFHVNTTCDLKIQDFNLVFNQDKLAADTPSIINHNDSRAIANRSLISFMDTTDANTILYISIDGNSMSDVRNATWNIYDSEFKGDVGVTSNIPANLNCMNVTRLSRTSFALITPTATCGGFLNASNSDSVIYGSSLNFPTEIIGSIDVYHPNGLCLVQFGFNSTGDLKAPINNPATMVCNTFAFAGGVNINHVANFLNFTNYNFQYNFFNTSFFLNCPGGVGTFSQECLEYDFQIKYEQKYTNEADKSSERIIIDNNCSAISPKFPAIINYTSSSDVMDFDMIRSRWQKDFGTTGAGTQNVGDYNMSCCNQTDPNGKYLDKNWAINNTIFHSGQKTFNLKRVKTIFWDKNSGGLLDLRK